jgi:hypothetical protein
MFVFVLGGIMDELILKALGGFVCGAAGICGAVISKKNPHMGGVLLIGSAIAGTYLLVWKYLIADVLLIIAGIIAIRKGDKLVDEETLTIKDDTIAYAVVTPMLLRRIDKPFDSDNHLAELKLDGIRLLAFSRNLSKSKYT